LLLGQMRVRVSVAWRNAVLRAHVSPPEVAARLPPSGGPAPWGGPVALWSPPEVAARLPPSGGRAPWGGPAALWSPPEIAARLPPSGGRAPWGGPAALMSTPRPPRRPSRACRLRARPAARYTRGGTQEGKQK